MVQLSYEDSLLTNWNIFLYWNRPSFAICDCFNSTHRSKYLNMIGSMTDSDQVYVNFLFRNTSWRVSKARAGLPTSINSVEKEFMRHFKVKELFVLNMMRRKTIAFHEDAFREFYETKRSQKIFNGQTNYLEIHKMDYFQVYRTENSRRKNTASSKWSILSIL